MLIIQGAWFDVYVIKEIIASIPEYPVCGIEVIFGAH